MNQTLKDELDLNRGGNGGSDFPGRRLRAGKEEGLDMGVACMGWKAWIGANGKSNLENQIWKDLNILISTKD